MVSFVPFNKKEVVWLPVTVESGFQISKILFIKKYICWKYFITESFSPWWEKSSNNWSLLQLCYVTVFCLVYHDRSQGSKQWHGLPWTEHFVAQQPPVWVWMHFHLPATAPCYIINHLKKLNFSQCTLTILESTKKKKKEGADAGIKQESLCRQRSVCWCSNEVHHIVDGQCKTRSTFIWRRDNAFEARNVGDESWFWANLHTDPWLEPTHGRHLMFFLQAGRKGCSESQDWSTFVFVFFICIWAVSTGAHL